MTIDVHAGRIEELSSYPLKSNRRPIMKQTETDTMDYSQHSMLGRARKPKGAKVIIQERNSEKKDSHLSSEIKSLS